MSAETFGRHFFTCKAVPRCEIGDTFEGDYFCPEGEALRWQLMRSVATPEDRAYLLHLADAAFDHDWERRMEPGVRTMQERHPIDRRAAQRGFVE